MTDPFQYIQSALALLTGDHVVLSVLLMVITGLALALKWVWAKYDALRAEAASQIKELQESLTELNGNYSEANNRTADTLAKIGDALLKLADLTAKK
jgi:hypothetical protein